MESLIEDVLDAFDLEAKGSLEFEQIKSLVNAVFGIKLRNLDILREIFLFSNSKKSKLSRAEIAPFCLQLVKKFENNSEVRKEIVNRYFSMFAEKPKSSFSLNEFRAVLAQKKIQIPPAEVKAMFDAFDSNQDGRIDAKEFENMMLGYKVSETFGSHQ